MGSAPAKVNYTLSQKIAWSLWIKDIKSTGGINDTKDPANKLTTYFQSKSVNHVSEKGSKLFHGLSFVWIFDVENQCFSNSQKNPSSFNFQSPFLHFRFVYSPKQSTPCSYSGDATHIGDPFRKFQPRITN